MNGLDPWDEGRAACTSIEPQDPAPRVTTPGWMSSYRMPDRPYVYRGKFPETGDPRFG